MRENKRLIGIASIIVAGTVTMAELHKNQQLPQPRQWLGIAVAFLFISIMSDLKLPIAGGFAALVTIATVLNKGDDAFAFVAGKTTVDRKALRRQAKADRRLEKKAGEETVAIP